MTTILIERNLNGSALTFEFSDKWKVCKYDEQPFYDKIKNQNLKAVDFMALSKKVLLLMEVKYITATDENSKLRFYDDSDKNILDEIKAKFTRAELKTVNISSARPYLVDEVSKKIRDTLLGLFANYRREETALSSYAKPLFTSNNQLISVLLFLERNTVLNQEENFKPLASHLKLKIEQKLSFLGNIQVGVVNTLTLPPELEIIVSAHSAI
jgi:hypothetical protein